MKNLFTFLVLATISIGVFAQVNQGGEPIRWQAANLDFTYERLPELDMTTIETEDAENDRYKEFAYRFGIERTSNLTINNSGIWTIEEGRNVWRLGIHAPNAKAVSVLFSEYELPKSAQIFIYDREQTHYIGSFNYKNKQANGMLATSLVYGEDVVIELSVPETQDINEIGLKIGQIVHAYRGFDSRFEEVKYGRGPFGTSGSCNININCPEGDDWQVEKKAVALIASGGSAVCSGALVNNTNNDGYPYFLTANHCLGGGVGNWVFYFNHESSTCGGSSGPTNQSVSGASIVANNSASDFGLLEINNGNAIPANFNAEWAGWDNSDSEAAVTAATGIHHPSGDVKKISHDTDGPTHNNQGGAAVWYINQWEDGTTEGGSSGSPLFNQDHRIIGQLYGGAASCQNQGGADWYGRFGVSWDNGSSSSTRLHDWLDPGNTGVTTLDGYPTGAVTYSLDAATAGFVGIPEALCEQQSITPVFVLKNNGTTTLMSATITYNYNGGNNQTIPWSGNLSQGDTYNVPLNSFTPNYGTNTINVTVSAPNGQTDENANNNSTSTSFDLTVGEDVLTLTLKTDNYGYETYWEVRGPSNQLVASGGNTSVGPNGGGGQTAQAGDPGAYGNNATYTETIQLDGDGCYSFLIVDDYGDGICCGFTGNGEYTLRDGNNMILAQGDQFDAEEEWEFGMIGGLSVKEADFGQLNIYPNPTSGVVYVDVEHYKELTEITVTDITGRIVSRSAPSNGKRSVVDLNNIASGVYQVNLIGTTGRLNRKIIVQ